MRKQMTQWAVIAGLSAAVLAGCKKEEPTATPPPGKPTVNVPASPTGPGPAVPIPTTKPAATTATTVGAATDPAKDAAPDAQAKDAQAKLEAVTQWVRESKFDQADLALKKIEQDQAKLPLAIQAKLGDARRMLDNAKLTSGGIRVPEAGLNK
jgi:hypothetical protein